MNLTGNESCLQMDTVLWIQHHLRFSLRGLEGLYRNELHCPEHLPHFHSGI